MFLRASSLKRRLIGASLSGVLIASFCVLGFYHWHHANAAQLREANGLTRLQGNAIKHSRASYQISKLLLRSGVSQAVVSTLIDTLGKTNEVAEHWVKPEHDSTAEMIRDMANNHVGFLLAVDTVNRRSGRYNFASLLENDIVYSSYERLCTLECDYEKLTSRTDFEAARSIFDTLKPLLKSRFDSQRSRYAPRPA